MIFIKARQQRLSLKFKPACTHKKLNLKVDFLFRTSFTHPAEF